MSEIEQVIYDAIIDYHEDKGVESETELLEIVAKEMAVYVTAALAGNDLV